MSKFMEYINDTITSYEAGQLGEAFNSLTDASIELEKETLEQLNEKE